MAFLLPDEPASNGEFLTAGDLARAQLYLGLLDSQAEGLDWRALAVRHFSWNGDGDDETVRAHVERHLERAIWLRDVGYRQLPGRPG